MGMPEFLPTAFDRQGVHISAELQISASQLRSYGIEWAAQVMDRASKHINALENQANKTKEPNS